MRHRHQKKACEGEKKRAIRKRNFFCLCGSPWCHLLMGGGSTSAPLIGAKNVEGEKGDRGSLKGGFIISCGWGERGKVWGSYV